MCISSITQAAIEYAECSNIDHHQHDRRKYLALQDLVLLVRDCRRDGDEYLAELLDDASWHIRNRKEKKTIELSFERLNMQTLPRPSEVVMDGEFDAEISVGDIGKKFLAKAIKFLKNSINLHSGLQPKMQNNGQLCQVDDMKKILLCCNALFDNFDESDNIETILKEKEKGIYTDMMEQAFATFLQEFKPDKFEDPEEKTLRSSNARDKALQKYQNLTSERPRRKAAKDFSMQYEIRLTEDCKDVSAQAIKDYKS